MVTNYVQNSSIYGVGESVVGQVRKANEDNCGYASTENGELFVVCDGMGGHVGGATASKIGVDSIINYISTHKHADKRVLLRDALIFANMQILGTASADATLKGMGTTACIALIEGDNTWLAHVGDSRIYLYSQKDKFLYRVSKDHSFVQGLVDSGQLDDRDAENHPQKNIILRALGIKEDMKPEVDAEPMHCAKGDIIMICSDGLSGMIDDVYMEKKIRESKANLEDLCQQLVDDANTPDKGKDNITCQLIRFETTAAGAPKHPDFTPKWRRPSGGGGNSTLPTGAAPKSKSMKLLWIGLAVLIVLIAGGIVGGMMYIAKHRHVFRPDAHEKYVLRSDNPEGINMNAELRPGVTPIKWDVNAKGVSIDANGYLKVDSTTYEAVPATRVKVEAEFRGKQYVDSILVHLEYIKVQELVEETPVAEEPVEQISNSEPSNEEPKKDLRKDEPKKDDPKKEETKKEQPVNKSNVTVELYTANRSYDPGELLKSYKQTGGYTIKQGEKYVFCVKVNGTPVTPTYLLVGETNGVTRNKESQGWYQFSTDETYVGGAKLKVSYDGNNIVINLPVKK